LEDLSVEANPVKYFTLVMRIFQPVKAWLSLEIGDLFLFYQPRLLFTDMDQSGA
jgi:hypothetical protein